MQLVSAAPPGIDATPLTPTALFPILQPTLDWGSEMQPDNTEAVSMHPKRVKELSSLERTRQELYRRLGRVIGHTPLTRLTALRAGNGCQIFVKEEHRNPTGSHYDRQTLDLLCGLETRGRIIPHKTRLWESTTGSSGASFAWMCRVLGYEAIIYIPQDMPDARIEQIKSYGAEVRYSPRVAYIDGLREAFSADYERDAGENDFPTDHSHQRELGVFGMKELGLEILRDFDRLQLGVPQYFVTALGNGISAWGVGSVLQEKADTILYGMEPFESPTVYYHFHADKYRKRFGDAELRYKPHIIYGTGPGQTIFPNIRKIGPALTDIFHPKEQDVVTFRDHLAYKELSLVGNSSAACVWACHQLAKQVPDASTIVTIAYDAAWRYLPLHSDSTIRALHDKSDATAREPATLST